MEVGFWRIVWYWSGGRFMKILFDVLSLIYEIIMVFFFFVFSSVIINVTAKPSCMNNLPRPLDKTGRMNHSAQLRKVARKSNFKALSDKLVEHLVFLIWTVDKTKLPWQLMHVAGFSLIANLLIKMAQNGFPVFKHQFLDWLVDTTTTLFFHLTMLSKKCQLFYKMCNNVYIVRGYQSLQAAF